MLQSTQSSFEELGINDCIRESIRKNLYVSGYRASLLYVMNGLAECVIISGNLPYKNQIILTQLCLSAAIPIHTLDEGVIDKIPSEIDVMTIIPPDE